MSFAKKISADQIVSKREFSDINSQKIIVPDEKKLIHLQFLRFAGCPYCNLHMHSYVLRKNEIDAAGIKEIVVFYSSVKALLPYQKQIPFDIIADPEKKLYKEFGVESSLLSIFDPRSWIAGIKGLLQKDLRGPMSFQGGVLGLPADFLIAPNGKVIAAKYGTHAYDQWSVDELLALAKK